jgi:hypothetical protein
VAAVIISATRRPIVFADFFGVGRFAAFTVLRLTALGATLRAFGAAFLVFFLSLAMDGPPELRKIATASSH